ncbi:MAG: helix-turn-helix domain-containing protein [Candidatus Entotheonellia bacterium]
MHAQTYPIFLTPKELAARWRLGLSTVYTMAQSGHLTYYQLGGSIRFKIEDIEAYEAAGCQRAVVWPKVLREKRRRVL